MSQFNFKSTGKKFNSREVQNDDITLRKQGIGIKTPLAFDTESSNGLFNMHFDSLEQVKDNLRNLVRTNRGERLNRMDYGCNLEAYTFDYADAGNFEKQITLEISSQVEKFMPFVIISQVSFLDYFKKETENTASDSRTIKPTGMAAIVVRIHYSVPKVGAQNQILEVVIFIGG
tara:strand:- start:285 stop:806 length:522 start_codon:yes stop_codon:yes gene_type:complete